MSLGKIMIVDDNNSLLRTMSMVLTRKGYTVVTALSGNDALILATEHSDIELVFMDIKMPLMNGVEAFKRLKGILPNAVVTMMTAYAVDELIQEALQEGAFAVIYKPLDFEKVLGIIQTAREEGEEALIMIVDDDHSTRTAFKKVLVKKGYNVISAVDGDEAIRIAKENDFDIAFIDMKLPTINGLETFLRMKEIRPNIVAVLITGFSTDYRDKIEQALVENARVCFNKPLDMIDILAAIEEILKRKRQKRTNSTTD